MVVYESLLDSVEEEIVETRVNDEDDDLRCSIPVLVDLHEAVSVSQVREGARGATHRGIGGGTRCAGIQMMNTAMLTIVLDFSQQCCQSILFSYSHNESSSPLQQSAFASRLEFRVLP